MAGAVAVGISEAASIAEKFYGRKVAQEELARERRRVEGELNRIGQLAATSALDALEPLFEQARAAIEADLWIESRGYYADFATPGGFIEDHLMIDSLTLARYGAIPEDRAVRLLDSAAAMLESRHNSQQPYGDWGVLCSYPPYKRPRDVRAKSAFAFRYHNGSDWPYLDGLYAEERLRRGLGGARYALTRWWEMCLASGWAGAVEYYSPPFGRGSLLQGWSAMPAAVAIKYGLAAVGAPAVRAAE